jgi:hypothetical protein
MLPVPARVVLAAAALGASACAPSGLYYWNGYDAALYRHYRNPQDRESFMAALATTVQEANSRGLRTPPGVSAELGYALYEEGRPLEAIPWFEREKGEWPESTLLMEKMVRNARQRAARQPAGAAPSSGAAGAATQRVAP